jgi:CubicO group peptidase (beta-lactamase class C family)
MVRVTKQTSRLTAYALLLPTTIAQTLLPAEDCPILGPAFPSTFDIESTKAFQNAVNIFPQRIEELFEDGTFNRSSSSISIDVFSTYTNRSIFSYYYAAPALEVALTQGVLNDATIQRIGSVSKLFTVYALIAKGGLGIFQDPVTKYIPELAGNPANDSLNKLHFESLTIEALASHISGTGGVSKLWQQIP